MKFYSLIIGLLLAGSCLAQGLQVGDLAPDFELQNIDGSMVSLDNYEGANGYIIIFTCNHCPFAVMYEDRINALYDKYNSLGYQIIAINPNDPEVKPQDSFVNMQIRAKEKGFQFPYIIDDKQEVYPQFGATKTPHIYLLDQYKVVRYIGAIDDSARDETAVEEKYLENAIEALRHGILPRPSVTKAIGCSIKTKS